MHRHLGMCKVILSSDTPEYLNTSIAARVKNCGNVSMQSVNWANLISSKLLLSVPEFFS